MEMRFQPAFWALVALGGAAAIAYGLFFLNKPPTLLRAAVKTLFLAAWSAAFAIAGAHTIIIIALAASALGDFFLAFDKKWILPLGILSFLIAQLTYFIVFFFGWMFAGEISPLWPRYTAMGLIITTSVGFLIWMAPRLGWLALGVVPYSIAITAMACMSFWLPWLAWPAMLGAISFVVSDFVLAAELFRLPPDAPARRITTPVVWWTYAAAQALIVWGIVLSTGAMV
jgi:uncharacterized membrane protein YhhN